MDATELADKAIEVVEKIDEMKEITYNGCADDDEAFINSKIDELDKLLVDLEAGLDALKNDKGLPMEYDKDDDKDDDQHPKQKKAKNLDAMFY